MAFYANLGYRFALHRKTTGMMPVPDGCIVLASGLPAHELVRRKLRGKHLAKRLFDPQLYMARLDANRSPRHCTVLAVYPWFGVIGLDEYDSGKQKQTEWRRNTQKRIRELWPGREPQDPELIAQACRACVDFQEGLDTEAYLIPSPLTTNPNTDYSLELLWLEASLDYINHVRRRTASRPRPVLATVALSDICIRHDAPQDNPLLDLVADQVSARGVDGVYLVLEQASETVETRHPGDACSLRSILHLVHTYAHDCGLYVAVNFLGQFGLACEAAGASLWASGWYKSTYRLRLADKLAGGRAYPSYWSHPAAVDIHLEKDFDRLSAEGLLPMFADKTEASAGLLDAATRTVEVAGVPEWTYRQSNVEAAGEHFLRSCIAAEGRLGCLSGRERADAVESWLCRAYEASRRIEALLGPGGSTQTRHVQAWLSAYRAYREDHKD